MNAPYMISWLTPDCPNRWQVIVIPGSSQPDPSPREFFFYDHFGYCLQETESDVPLSFEDAARQAKTALVNLWVKKLNERRTAEYFARQAEQNRSREHVEALVESLLPPGHKVKITGSRWDITPEL